MIEKGKIFLRSEQEIEDAYHKHPEEYYEWAKAVKLEYSQPSIPGRHRSVIIEDKETGIIRTYDNNGLRVLEELPGVYTRSTVYAPLKETPNMPKKYYVTREVFRPTQEPGHEMEWKYIYNFSETSMEMVGVSVTEYPLTQEGKRVEYAGKTFSFDLSRFPKRAIPNISKNARLSHP